MSKPKRRYQICLEALAKNGELSITEFKEIVHSLKEYGEVRRIKTEADFNEYPFLSHILVICSYSSHRVGTGRLMDIAQINNKNLIYMCKDDDNSSIKRENRNLIVIYNTNTQARKAIRDFFMALRIQEQKSEKNKEIYRNTNGFPRHD